MKEGGRQQDGEKERKRLGKTQRARGVERERQRKICFFLVIAFVGNTQKQFHHHNLGLVFKNIAGMS